MARARAGLKSLLLIPALTGCTSFGTIRSAEVQPGLSLIIGTGQRQEVDRTNHSFTTIFGALSMGLSFHGPRD